MSREINMTPAQAGTTAELGRRDSQHEGVLVSDVGHGLIGVRHYHTVAGEAGRSARSGFRTEIINPKGEIVHASGLGA